MAKLVSVPNCIVSLLSYEMLIKTQFAKHMKVDEQVALLKNKKTGIGVGTPARLMELIDNGMVS